MRHLVLTALVLLVACGRSPSSPSTSSPVPVVSPASFAGLWTGTFRLMKCSGERYCQLDLGKTRAFTVRLRQSGAQVKGLFTQGIHAADLSGEVLKDGSVVLSGSTPASSIKESSMQVTGLALRLSPDQGLQGTLAYETQPDVVSALNLPGSGSGDIVSATRADLETFAAAIDGTWTGRFVIRSCTPSTGTLYCYPFQNQDLVPVLISLKQTADGVTGTLTPGSQTIPVSGHKTDTIVSLSGEGLSAVSGGSSLIRVSRWTGRVDEFGRMKATFQYEFAYPSGAPVLGESAIVELEVVKVPS